MAKSINLGNGKVLIGLDKYAQVKDLYFHYAGLENHINQFMVHKIGIYVDSNFSWLDDGKWDIQIRSEKDTMASDINAINNDLGLELHFTDVVYNEKNILIREITVVNKFERKRNLKIFFNQQFNISLTKTGDTAYYDPVNNVVIHYKGRRVFLVNARGSDHGINSFCVGLLGIEGKAGTYKDAEDGILSENPVEHGQVDSVIQFDLELDSNKTSIFHYWITIAKSIEKAILLNELVVNRTPADIVKTTKDYWRAWVKIQNFSFYGLGEPIITLFNQSLIYIRTHVNDNGSIIASGDSDMLQFGRDTYAYVWPRDAAFSALALEKAGDFNASKRFLRFCNDIVSEKGYFMHKYRPDKSLGSSWHPWVRDGQKQLPIQEDETALVLYALWEHFELTRDIEFVEGIYNSFIKKTADFMVNYRDGKTGLPAPSYDLWEQDYGIHTFTASTVYGALKSAAKFAKLFGKSTSADKYDESAETIKKGILKYLYSKEDQVFYKSLREVNNNLEPDKTLDMSSVYGIFKFNVLPIDDVQLKNAFDKTIERLAVKTQVGGFARFESDAYHHQGGDYPGNPWVITTMWVAQYYLARAKSESDMEELRKLISWAVDRASLSGTLSEQFDPYNGNHLSASPLIWSHAEYVITIINYLKKLEDLGICKACYPLT